MTVKKSISIIFDVEAGKTITVNRFPVLADDKSFTLFVFSGKRGSYISSIVLGVEIKGQMFPNQERKNLEIIWQKISNSRCIKQDK